MRVADEVAVSSTTPKLSSLLGKRKTEEPSASSNAASSTATVSNATKPAATPTTVEPQQVERTGNDDDGSSEEDAASDGRIRFKARKRAKHAHDNDEASSTAHEAASSEPPSSVLGTAKRKPKGTFVKPKIKGVRNAKLLSFSDEQDE